MRTFFFIFLITLAVIGCKNNEIVVEEQIPILAWDGVKEQTIERYLELKEAGFTHNFSFFADADKLAMAMGLAEKAGIKMILRCPELETKTEETVNRFKDHPALAGYFLRDEPRRRDFPKLGEWARKIQAIDNEHFCYLNLYPNYGRKEILETETYREYVQLFIEEVPLQLLSFDHYPVIVNENGERVLRDMWYENLEIFSEEAEKVGKPFWAFALTVAHDPYPIPTLAELRLQVYSNLAYGAQGIQYFTYWTAGPSIHWNFHHAAIDRDTKKRTEVYDKLKIVNQEIKNLSFVFKDAKVISVSHTGTTIPKGTKQLDQVPKMFQKLEINGEAIVSLLDKKDQSYLVIVNKDFKNSMEIAILGKPEVNRVLKDGTIVPANLYHDFLLVDPGDILIYNWKKG